MWLLTDIRESRTCECVVKLLKCENLKTSSKYFVWKTKHIFALIYKKIYFILYLIAFYTNNALVLKTFKKRERKKKRFHLILNRITSYWLIKRTFPAALEVSCPDRRRPLVETVTHCWETQTHIRGPRLKSQYNSKAPWNLNLHNNYAHTVLIKKNPSHLQITIRSLLFYTKTIIFYLISNCILHKYCLDEVYWLIFYKPKGSYYM